MSDHWLYLIPSEPHYVPDARQQERAYSWTQAHFPNADGIRLRVTPAIEFIDPGGNFERVLCHLCGTDCKLWWSDTMERQYDHGFHDLTVTSGCCQQQMSLNDLNYQFPAGFARFLIEVNDPDRKDLTGTELLELELIVGGSLRRIWCRL